MDDTLPLNEWRNLWSGEAGKGSDAYLRLVLRLSESLTVANRSMVVERAEDACIAPQLFGVSEIQHRLGGAARSLVDGTDTVAPDALFDVVVRVAGEYECEAQVRSAFLSRWPQQLEFAHPAPPLRPISTWWPAERVSGHFRSARPSSRYARTRR